MQKILIPYLVAAALCGCVSTETAREMADLRSTVATLQEEISAAPAGSPEAAALAARLADVEGRLEVVRGDAVRERIANGADTTVQVVEAAKPIVGAFFAPALIALNLVGGLALWLRNKYRKVPEVKA